MLPPKRGVKRRSASKFGESPNPRSSSAADGPRKQSRLDEASATVPHDGSRYTTKFGWPYVPLLSNDQTYQWCKMMRTYLLDCFYTRKGSNRQGTLLSPEIAEVDRKIEHMEDKYSYWDRAHWRIDMMTELSHLFKFSNAFVVTNETPYTAVKLNQKPLVDTWMWYGCPLILRLVDAFSDDPIEILDWRPGTGGTQENPIRTILFPTRHIPVTYEKKLDYLLVTLPFKGPSITFKVEWAGPYEGCVRSKRGPLQEWTTYYPGSKDSLLVPTSTMQELMARWLPYVKKLAETKRHGVHRKLCDGDYLELQREVERQLQWIGRVAAGEEVTPHFARDFEKAMCYLRVVNLTEGSMVLLRTRYCSYACRYLKVARIELNPIDIIAAEVHLSGGDIYEIKEKMINVEVVEDSLEVRITVTGFDSVVLRISWLGPNYWARPNETWRDFMGFEIGKEIIQSDLDRAEANKKEVTRFGWPYVPQLTNEELLDWFKVMYPHFLAVFQTRKGSNRQGTLLPSEVDVTDRLIMLGEEMLSFWMNTEKSIDMNSEISYLFRFTNAFVVTNMTPYTIVKLNRKPLVDTTLKFHCPLILRLEDAISNDPIRILDWRPGSGGTEQNPIEDEIDPTRLVPLTHEIHVDSLIVKIPFKDTTLTFSVEWCGPYVSLGSFERGALPEWTDYITHPNATESLVVPTQSSFPELMTKWLPYLRKLGETKKHGVHRTLNGEAYAKLQRDVKAKLEWFERVANGEDDRLAFRRDFYRNMQTLRVVNLTEGSEVLLRTRMSSYALRYLKVARIDLTPIDIIAAEVHFPGRDLYVIRENMIDVEVVGDSLEVTITPAENVIVVLKVSWFGPMYRSPTNDTWDLFMGFGRKKELVQADYDRAQFHKWKATSFGWPYVPQLTNEELLNWFRVIHPHLLAAFETRKGSDRKQTLLPSEVAVTDKFINQAENLYLTWATTKKSIDMMGKLPYLSKFVNVFFVTNMTKYTIVKLNRKPLVDTTLKFDCPLGLRLEDAFSNDPIRILDWRPGSGGTERNPIESEIYPTRFTPFTLEKHVDFFYVHVPFKNTTLTFSVEWCGPYDFCDSPERGELPEWTENIKHPNATDSLVAPKQFSLPELLTRWLPSMWKLAETKKHGVHRTLDGEAFEKLQREIKEKLQWFERVAKGEEVGQSFPRDFTKFMKILRVVNLTEGSTVLLRTRSCIHALRYLSVAQVELASIDVIAAEVHFPGRDFYVIKEHMINTEVVFDTLEVRITPAKNEFVVLRVSWFGPNSMSPVDMKWDMFMGFGRHKEPVQADLDRADFYKKRSARG